MKRIYSIDFVRGFVMIIMALDHVRDMMHVNSITQSPTNLETTSPLLFFTRWITYLCAPTFVFLAGTSAFISFKRSASFSKSRRFLLKRGLYLILLEFVVVNFALFFDFGFHTFIFEVIAAIGFGFIILSLLLKSSVKTIGIAGLVIIFCHNLFPFIPMEQGSLLKAIVSPFFVLSALPFSHSVLVFAYPPVPWLGIMLVGFASGKFFELPVANRRKLFFKIGWSALLLFVIVRFINIYGDPLPWSSQKNYLFTFLSFFNVAKYPPSLLFCLVTLGPMFLLLAFAERAKSRVGNIISVYGKVPMFYFLIHFFLIHFIMIALMLLQGFHWSQLDFASGTFGRPKGVQSGVSLLAIYLLWIFVVAILYKPCQWFGKYKAAHQQWWLKYL
ncbi:MAG: heparan-alpha-glucosaminide N-acetyltransferase domain-containing protein [Bacteroidota bacterium]|nr:heparan-alpha-glucosaminide N-acetyltransferase domain-containing protein [Bacteroidota bacterium]